MRSLLTTAVKGLSSQLTFTSQLQDSSPSEMNRNMPVGKSVGLVTLNSRYAHAAPGIRILRNLAREAGLSDVWCEEFTINESVWKMADTILRHGPDIIGISISIWNREKSFELARHLRVARPELILVAGGPEVSFEDSCPDEFNHLVRGEGEGAWLRLLGISGEAAPVWPYLSEDLPSLRGRMAYLETTRGCPYRCAFCLSGHDGAWDGCDVLSSAGVGGGQAGSGDGSAGGVSAACASDEHPGSSPTAQHPLGHWREWLPFPRERFIEETRKLVDAGVTCVKFLDRTFNADPKRALEWFRDIARIPGNFHFEIRAELLNDATLKFLRSVPPGKFQFEVGIQSLTPSTLSAIGKSPQTDVLLRRLRQLLDVSTVHVHADLIWGLPEEGLNQIIDTFNRLAPMGFHELQLGFLKFLPGAPVRDMRKKYGYVHQPQPPYEVLRHDGLSGEELLRLKRIENAFEVFYNSQRFSRSLRYVFAHSGLTPFEVIERLSDGLIAQGAFRSTPSLDATYRVFADAFAECGVGAPVRTGACAGKPAETRTGGDAAADANNGGSRPNQLPLLLDYLLLDYATSQRVYRIPPFLRGPLHTPSGGHDTIFVCFRHQFDPSTWTFKNVSAPDVYLVKHSTQESYFRDVSITRKSDST